MSMPRGTRWWLALYLWTAGMAGVIVLVVLVVPQLLALAPEMLAQETPPFPLWVLAAASLLQSAVLLFLAVWAGSACAPAVGLRAPVFEALVRRDSPRSALTPQLVPGLIGGALGAGLLIAFPIVAPLEIADAQRRLDVPLLARVLYGGITEEILLRWGFMTFVLWGLWRVLQRRVGAPRSGYVWFAIVFSAVAFGVGHLPAAAMVIGRLTPPIVIVIVAANALFGIVAGYLYWRYGLESAMLAHIVAHVMNYAIEIS